MKFFKFEGKFFITIKFEGNFEQKEVVFKCKKFHFSIKFFRSNNTQVKKNEVLMDFNECKPFKCANAFFCIRSRWSERSKSKLTSLNVAERSGIYLVSVFSFI